ncbi:MAG: carbamoyl-phosphate synthase large subunit, partial [Clostridiales bacterium]|nr:carbamoyl-phosphate synthase large subunit [Clostridiales bacterium]
DFGEALFKGLTGAGFSMHKKTGNVVISVRPADKQEAIPIAEKFEKLGYELYATRGTANTLNRAMVATNAVYNAFEPDKHPNILDMIENGEVDYVLSTSVKGRHPELASVKIRRCATEHAIPCLTAIDTANALLQCLESGMEIPNCEMVDINSI